MEAMTTTAAPLTIADLKKFEANPATSLLRAALKAAQKQAVETRAKVDAYEAPIFARFQFTDREGATIANQRGLYRCNDDAKLAAYFSACDEAHKANGYNLPDGYCPALVAENAVIDAEKALLKHATAQLGIDFAGIWQPELRRKAINLLTNPPRA